MHRRSHPTLSYYAATACPLPAKLNWPNQQNQQNIYSLNVTSHLHPDRPLLPCTSPLPSFVPAARCCCWCSCDAVGLRTLPNQSARHVPYPSAVKSHAQQQHHLPSTNTSLQCPRTSLPPALKYRLRPRQCAARIHYRQPRIAVETLLGPWVNTTCHGSSEAGADYGLGRTVQPRAADGTLPPPQTLSGRDH